MDAARNAGSHQKRRTSNAGRQLQNLQKRLIFRAQCRKIFGPFFRPHSKSLGKTEVSIAGTSGILPSKTPKYQGNSDIFRGLPTIDGVI
jgi:hypothetical protein